MNANEARKRAEAALKAKAVPDVSGHVRDAHRLISGAVERGEMSIPDPLEGLRMIVTREARMAFHAAMRGEGYAIGDDGSIHW